jgi:2-succinyl-5-enolpyruvyl-6-hydroxy-3-cyclohexene-1-carboxylate synthase
MNIAWCRKILSRLHREGVRDVVFCAGARNSPLVAVLAKTTGIKLYSFFEERSAAFFALGVARRSGLPVAIVTTSGTAAAELLPAVIEAFHTGVPLVLLTADRPRRLRGTGAPQAIDQVGLFGKFVAMEFDLEEGEMFSLEHWHRRAPVHLNICFDEPLIDSAVEPLELCPLAAVGSPEEPRSFAGTSPFAMSTALEWSTVRLTRFLRGSEHTGHEAGPLVVVVGTLETEAEREAVAKFLLRLRVPVYLEGTSGLREREDLQPFVLRSGDKLLAWALGQGGHGKQNLISRVLRIGGVPTVRIWRDLDSERSPVQVLSLTSLPFAGLSRGEMICCKIDECLREVTSTPERNLRAATLLAKDREVEMELLRLYTDEPLAEPSLIHALSRRIPQDAFVYVGNSLPIREWDLAASFGGEMPIAANRGVNGIDGQLSTFLGMAEPGRENWAVFGDLTTLYDLTGPWALAYGEDAAVRIVVVNNGGGRIFSRLFGSSLFENSHSFEFEYWAKMWRLGYQRWTSVPAQAEMARVEVIELVPDAEATKRFWDRYDKLWS